MSPIAYKFLHLVGLFMVFLSYGALIARALFAPEEKAIRRLGAITSGIGLLLLLVSGIGFLHKAHLGFPPWAWVKIALWLLLGAMLVWINNQPRFARRLWWGTILIGVAAAWLALYKPF
jgi:uncharacterized membrane protein SirB2